MDYRKRQICPGTDRYKEILWFFGMFHYRNRFFYDSRTTSLDDLITEVLSNGQEMNTSSTNAMQTVLRQPVYSKILQNAYPGSSQEQAGEKMVNAIAMYIHSLLSYQSRFDAYMRNPSDQISGAEKEDSTSLWVKAMRQLSFCPLLQRN